MTPEQNLILKLEGILMISPLGYHRRGAANEAFALLMDNAEIVHAAYEAKWASQRHKEDGEGAR